VKPNSCAILAPTDEKCGLDPTTAGVVVAAGEPALAEAAATLASRLGFALRDDDPPAPRFVLLLCRDGLELRDRKVAPGKGMRVDFVGGYHGYRRRFGGGRTQPLGRAIGLKRGATPRVLDATAGLGKDGFVLATLGCSVTLCERSPVFAALLEDGIRRAAYDPGIGTLVRQHLQLKIGDSRTILPRLAARSFPDVIYLDPMYPRRDRRALVKAELRTIRALVGDDTDAGGLLDQALALARARCRVVVKRPAKAPALTGPAPSHAIHSPDTRYDVYLP
jgi:16S rRNA (guanine1516-N2)-methyltransferase